MHDSWRSAEAAVGSLTSVSSPRDPLAEGSPNITSMTSRFPSEYDRLAKPEVVTLNLSTTTKQEVQEPSSLSFPLDMNANDFAYSVEQSSPVQSVVDDSMLALSPGIEENKESKATKKPEILQSTGRILDVTCSAVNGYLRISQMTPTPDDPEYTGLKDRSRDANVTVSPKGSDVSGYMNLRQKSKRKLLEERPRPKRQAARDMCRPLKQWLYCHRDTPYPSKAEKQKLAQLSNMTLTQVSNWFANARRRLKNTVSGGPDVTWERRIKLYNRFVVGNQELLSVSSDDNMWDEEDEETMEATQGGNIIVGKEQGQATQGPEGVELRLTDTNAESSSVSGDEYGSLSQPRFCFEPETEEESNASAILSSACVTPAKFKQGILQRYLTDACQRVAHVKRKGEEEGEEEEEEQEHRHRNASGSLSSHDYEEMSLSARSTPVREHQTTQDEIQEDGKNTKHKISSLGDPDDLYWKEMSAALALTNLAMRSRLYSGSSQASSSRI